MIIIITHMPGFVRCVESCLGAYTSMESTQSESAGDLTKQRDQIQ